MGKRDVEYQQRMTRQCQACRKDGSLPVKEWSPSDQGWACGLCVEKEEKIASMERELERLKAKVAAGERDIRRMLKPLREVWLEVGQPRGSNSKSATR